MKITKALPLLLVLVGGWAVTACSSGDTEAQKAESRQQINSGVDSALTKLYGSVKGSQALAEKAKGILVFPNVYAAGFIVGASYGQGALRIGSRTEGYYNIASGSFGFLAGAQSTAMVFLFMTPEALADFRSSSGWQAGANAGIAVVNVGAQGNVDTRSANQPVLVFIYGSTGLMGNVSVAGTKINKLDL